MTKLMTLVEKKEVINNLLDLWKPKLGLDGWITRVEIKETNSPEDPTCEAEIEDDLKYHFAELIIWDSFWGLGPHLRSLTIVHELMHLVVCRLHPYMGPAGDDAMEEVVQTLAVLFYHHF